MFLFKNKLSSLFSAVFFAAAFSTSVYAEDIVNSRDASCNIESFLEEDKPRNISDIFQCIVDGDGMAGRESGPDLYVEGLSFILPKTTKAVMEKYSLVGGLFKLGARYSKVDPYDAYINEDNPYHGDTIINENTSEGTESTRVGFSLEGTISIINDIVFKFILAVLVFVIIRRMIFVATDMNRIDNLVKKTILQTPALFIAVLMVYPLSSGLNFGQHLLVAGALSGNYIAAIFTIASSYYLALMSGTYIIYGADKIIENSTDGETLTEAVNGIIDEMSDEIIITDMALDYALMPISGGGATNANFQENAWKEANVSPACINNQYWHFNSAYKPECEQFRRDNKMFNTGIFKPKYASQNSNVQEFKDRLSEFSDSKVSESMVQALINFSYMKAEDKKNYICSLSKGVSSEYQLENSFFCTRFDYTNGNWVEGSYYGGDTKTVSIEYAKPRVGISFINNASTRMLNNINKKFREDMLVKIKNYSIIYRGVLIEPFNAIKLSKEISSFTNERISDISSDLMYGINSFTHLIDKTDLDHFKFRHHDYDIPAICFDEGEDDYKDGEIDCSLYEIDEFDSEYGEYFLDDIFEEGRRRVHDVESGYISKKFDEANSFSNLLNKIGGWTSSRFGKYFGADPLKCSDDLGSCIAGINDPFNRVNDVANTVLSFGFGSIIASEVYNSFGLNGFSLTSGLNQELSGMGSFSLFVGFLAKVTGIFAFSMFFFKVWITMLFRLLVNFITQPLITVNFLIKSSGDTEMDNENVLISKKYVGSLIRSVVDSIALAIAFISSFVLAYVTLPLADIILSMVIADMLGFQVDSVVELITLMILFVCYVMFICWVFYQTAKKIPYIFDKITEFVEDTTGVSNDPTDEFLSIVKTRFSMGISNLGS